MHFPFLTIKLSLTMHIHVFAARPKNSCFLGQRGKQTAVDDRKRESASPSVVSNTLQPYGPEPARLLCPWDSPGKESWSG